MPIDSGFTKRGALFVPSASASSNGGRYEGASRGLRLGGWIPSDTGPNASIRTSVTQMRARQRQLTRDNGVALSARTQFVTQVVGRGLRPKFNFPDAPGLQSELTDLWRISASEFDASGSQDIYGLQELALNTQYDGGEALARRLYRGMTSGLTVPVQVQLLEPDHIDSEKDVLYRGRRVRQGIEVGPDGRALAYWLFPNHPGENYYVGPNVSRRVPADQILHLYHQTRAGQLRGVPFLHAVIVALHNLGQYQDAELERKKQAAMHVGTIWTERGDLDPSEIFPGDPDDPDAWIYERADFYSKLGKRQPGDWPVLPPGDRIDYNNPADVGANYLDFTHEQKREIAAATGITFEQLTGYMRNVNHASARVRLIDIRRGLAMHQRRLAFQFCRGVVGWWLDAAVLAGVLAIPNYTERRSRLLASIQWVPDGFQSVAPLQDYLTDDGEVRSGFSSRTQKQTERGHDPDVIEAEIAEENRRADAQGFVFDSDARKTAGTGALQGAREKSREPIDDNEE